MTRPNAEARTPGPYSSATSARARRRLAGRLLAGLGAAVAVAIAVGLLNRGGAWRVVGTSGQGVVVVGGRPVPIGHVADLSSWMRGGSRVRVPPGCSLEIEIPGAIAIRMEPETDLVLPQPPGRWLGRAIAGRMTAGAISVTAGPAFRAGRMEIVTPSARVRLAGATATVRLESHGTLVMVLEGVALAGKDPSDAVEIRAGNLGFLYTDGSPTDVESLEEGEASALEAFRDRRREAWSAPR